VKESGVMTYQTGVYISVPFCKAKCSYCNFASGVFGTERMERYVDRVCGEIDGVGEIIAGTNAALPQRVDTIFLGGGTPSLLSGEQMRCLFTSLRNKFEVAGDAEVTLECAPGQLSDETLEEMLRLGMNRISFGVQSFVDAEAKAVGRLHTRAVCVAEIQRMQSAGILDINVDLIVGLPGQTASSWHESVEIAIASGVPHVSVYMLEVDEDSRLGREMLADGTRYGASNAPTEDEIAEWYGAACEWLEGAGVRQYEISNFARAGHASRHNVKYWRRNPYLGFGLDAHSMLRTRDGAVRWANPSDLDEYMSARDGAVQQLPTVPELMVLGGAMGPEIDVVGTQRGFEEAMFLGLRMNEGVDLEILRAEFGDALVVGAVNALYDVRDAGLVVVEGNRVKLSAEGRMASNEVFGRLLVVAV
jgi:oxygen-independent coproporphyrinogen-3 oxidase